MNGRLALTENVVVLVAKVDDVTELVVEAGGANDEVPSTEAVVVAPVVSI